MNDPLASRAFPRITISDLLVLMLTVSAGFAWIRAIGADEPGAQEFDWMTQARTVAWMGLEGTLIGVQFFGLAVLVRELIRGMRGRDLAPGHWWFLISVPQLVVGLLRYVALAWGEASWFSADRPFWLTIVSLAGALVALVFAIIWLRCAFLFRQLLWRAVFSLKALEQLDWFLFELHRAARRGDFPGTPSIHPMHFFGSMGSLHVCLLAALATAVVYDFRRGVKRDWLHYLGVGVMVADSLNFFQGFGDYTMRWWSAIVSHLLP